MPKMLSIVSVLLLLGVGTQKARGGDEGVAVPRGARIRLEPDRTVWRLGENVIVRYIVENASDEAFTVDWGGDNRSIRPLRNLVDVFDASGALLEDPTPDPSCFGGFGGTIEVTMSTPLVIEVTVPRYRLFERPGRHRIRVMHDLGWAVDHGGGHRDWQMLETPGEDDPRWVETTIEMFEPPAEEIDKILDVMKEGPRRGDQSGLRRNAAWSDFETIRHPAYLPALVKRARARGSHEPEWLVGIRSIETPDATRALVDLLTEGGLERRAAALVDRVPRPEVVPELIEHAAMVHPDRAVQASRMSRVWRDEFAAPTRAWAREHLGGRWAARVPHHAAYFLASVGTPEDLPALVDGLSQALSYADVEPARQADASERGRLAMLYQAITHLHRRGAEPPLEPVSSAEIAMALLWIREMGAEALPAYESRLGAWLTHDEIAIRDLTLRCLPRPLPEVAVEHLAELVTSKDKQLRITALQAIGQTGDERFRALVAKEMRAADDTWWISIADAAAMGVGLGLAERVRIHVDALGDETTFGIHFQYLMLLFGNRGWGSTGIPDPAERARLQKAWTLFLSEHGEAIDEGHRFDVTDPETQGLIPSTVEVRPLRR